MLDYLGLDDARKGAMTRLIQQAHADADLIKSACDDQNNPDGAMVKALMMDLPTMSVTGAVWRS